MLNCFYSQSSASTDVRKKKLVALLEFGRHLKQRQESNNQASLEFLQISEI